MNMYLLCRPLEYIENLNCKKEQQYRAWTYVPIALYSSLEEVKRQCEEQAEGMYGIEQCRYVEKSKEESEEEYTVTEVWIHTEDWGKEKEKGWTHYYDILQMPLNPLHSIKPVAKTECPSCGEPVTEWASDHKS